jgi:hypothetical protein
MQPIPIPFEPTNLKPCMTLRSRREYNTHDATNTRLVEHWQTDAPQLFNSRRDVSGAVWWMDMNPTSSRLYRENLLRSQPFEIPAANAPVTKETVELGFKTSAAISDVQKVQEKLRQTPNSAVAQSLYKQIQQLGIRKSEITEAKEQLLKQQKETQEQLNKATKQEVKAAMQTLLTQNQERQTFLTGQLQQINSQLAALQEKSEGTQGYQTTNQLLQQLQTKQLEVEVLNLKQKQVQVDTLSENPYFNKYDVAGDSRNIIRELRGVVSEDIVDRGFRESQRMLAREMTNRWLPANYAETQGLNSLQAYDLMRPKFNDMGRSYR